MLRRSLPLFSTTNPSYLVLGSGSAGSVLTHRLLEAGETVTVVDAGGWGNTGVDGLKGVKTNPLHFWKFSMPSALTYNLAPSSTYNYHYMTTKQKNMNGRQIDQPRGKVIGGSSNLNAMVYVRGNAGDFDKWVPSITQSDDKIDWSYKSCLPYFKKAQNDKTPIKPFPDYEDGGSDILSIKNYKGYTGPLTVTNGSTFSTKSYPGKPEVLNRSPLFDVLVRAGIQAGYKYTPDSNGRSQEGFGPMDQTVTERGERCSTELCYVTPHLDESGKPEEGLEVLDKHRVVKINFDGKVAKSVTVVDERTGEEKTITPEKEIISCLGSIGSPHVLMCSGVGPKEELEKFNIPLVHDSPEMGKNLQDHLEFYVQFHSQKPVTLFPVGNWLPYPWYRVMVGLEWILNSGAGLAGSNQFETGGFIRSDKGVKWPDIQYHFVPGAVVGQSDFLPYHAYQAHCGTLRPTSRGAVTLNSGSTADAPDIDPNYLSTEEDIVDLRKAFRLTDEILHQPAFDEYRGDKLGHKDVDVNDDKQVDEWIKSNSHSAYHPCGTCAMGTVTDSTGKLKGVEGIRIVDASLMPNMTSGNLNSPVIMMAEKIADDVLGKGQLEPDEAEVWFAEEWKSNQR
ncbi:hypothetical protein TrLO_g7063 [Triparma laevis f. longispina]|uniref:Glucose-methanol-choline oxidoreductase N-terminal domain-containing protein n=1 Tax=Triparma laevis f. longispina TaxID=1714387 RepID=A0A9W7EA65_9STRA|nr:hypothetical protein TrLO_g7063 [Triparma laevis f. longispina]